jgi:glycosyltransferase involved in cell wall biosynthesis
MTKEQNSRNNLPIVALISSEIVGKNMASIGIRYWELARALGQHTPVRLIVAPFVSMEPISASEELPMSLHVCTQLDEFRSLVEACDVIVTSDLVLFFYPFLAELRKPLVLDLYALLLVEGIQGKANANLVEQIISFQSRLEMLRIMLQQGDFFLCASERHRDYVLGLLSVAGRVNPYTHRHDHSLRRLLDVVPFGIPQTSPVHTRPVLKGIYKTIETDDRVLIWTGGIWEWFDATTLIKAMPIVLQKHPKTKLFFMGVKHPHKAIERTAALDETIALSQELGLYEQSVFFNDWVPYKERHNYLLEADLGISLHLDHLETRYSFRTRLLDHLWTGLPTISTKGDSVSEFLAGQGLAYLVEPGDVKSVAQTIIDLLNNPTLRTDSAARFEQVAAQYRWEIVAQPLIKFCTNPYFAPDKPHLEGLSLAGSRKSEPLRLLGRSWQAMRLGGLKGLLKQGKEYIHWKFSKYHKI